MEEELSFLRRKVNRLEDMIFNINDKIGLILEKFLNHRASHVAGIREVLQVEEGICLSLVTQLNSCIISNSSSNRLDGRDSTGAVDKAKTRVVTQARNVTGTRSSFRQLTPASTGQKSSSQTSASVGPLPCVVLTRQSAAEVSTTMTTTTNKKRRRLTDEIDNFDKKPEENDPMQYEQEDSNLPNSFTINIKTEQTDLAFQPDDEGNGGFDLGQLHLEDENQEQEQEDSGRDPDFRAASSSRSSSAKAQARVQADPQQPQLQPRPKKAFVFSRSFPSLDEAKAQLKAEGEFLFRTKMYTSAGTKYYFRCRHSGNGSCRVKCPYLLVNEETGGVDEYVSTDPPQHTHRQKIDKRLLCGFGLAAEVKAVLDEIVLRLDGGTSAANVDRIYEDLLRRGFEEADVPKHKIKNYLARQKRRHFGDLSFMRRRKPKLASRSAGSGSKPENRQKQLNQGKNQGKTPAADSNSLIP